MAILLAGLCWALAASPPPPALPSGAQIVAAVKSERPRLLLTRSRLEHIRRRIASDAPFQAWHAQLLAKANRTLPESVSQYEIPDGLRLLATSRRVLDRTFILGLAYQLSGDGRYRDRLWRELEAAAAFPDWNPRHFLDTAEMTNAFALAYDWLYADWSDAQRHTLRQAMLRLGLTPALTAYRGLSPNGWWVRAEHNWNQVCNGGIGMGALALAEDEPALAGEILGQVVRLLPGAMAHYGPDGAWNEGPGYWHYATSYTVMILDALETATGTDYGLAQIPGFSLAGDMPIYLTGPTRRTFNFADVGSDRSLIAPEMFWLAQKFKRPEYARYQMSLATGDARDLLWHAPAALALPRAPLSLDKHFRGSDVLSFRTGWADPQALFVAAKAGDNKANHSHLDVGSFVVDALGQRWVVDLGSEDYNLPGYFGKERWTYYRLRAEGHNLPVIMPDTGPDQDPKAAGQVLNFTTTPDAAWAIMDLSAAYARSGATVKRGLRLQRGARLAAQGLRGQLLVQDEITLKTPGPVWWFMHTPARVEVSAAGQQAILTIQDQRLLARLWRAPAGAKFSVREATPLPTSPQPKGQKANAGIVKLAIQVAPDNSPITLAVLLTPLTGAAVPAEPPEFKPLAEW